MDCIRHVKTLNQFDQIRDVHLEAMIKIYQFCGQKMTQPTHIFHELVFLYRKMNYFARKLLDRREKETGDLVNIYEKGMHLVNRRIQEKDDHDIEVGSDHGLLTRNKAKGARLLTSSSGSNFLLSRNSMYMEFNSIEKAVGDIADIEAELSLKVKQLEDHGKYVGDLNSTKQELDVQLNHLLEWKKYMDELRRKYDEATLHLRRITKKNIEELKTYVILPPTMHALLTTLGLFLGGVDVKSQEQLKKILNSQGVVYRMVHMDLSLISEERVSQLLYYYKHKDLSEHGRQTISPASYHFIDWINAALSILHETRIGRENHVKRVALTQKLQEVEATIERAEGISIELNREKDELDYKLKTSKLGYQRAQIAKIVHSSLSKRKRVGLEEQGEEDATLDSFSGDELVEILANELHVSPEFQGNPKIRAVEEHYARCTREFQDSFSHSNGWRNSLKQLYSDAKKALIAIPLDLIQKYLLDERQWKSSSTYAGMRVVFFSIFFEALSFPVSITQIEHRVH